MDVFQPDGLPDARDRRVPDEIGLEHLLAALDGLCVAGVVDGHDQLILTLPERLADVKGEGIIAPLMRANRGTVDENPAGPIHRAKVQQDAPAPPVGIKGEGSAVPQPLIRLELPFDAGQGALDGEGHPDL